MTEPLMLAISVEAKDMLEKFDIKNIFVDDGTLVLVTDRDVTILVHPIQEFAEQVTELL